MRNLCRIITPMKHPKQTPELKYVYEAKEWKGQWKIVRKTYNAYGDFVKSQTLHKRLGKGETEDLMFRYENNLPILNK
jgi:hypothetical protein